MGRTHEYVLYATTKTGILIRKELQPLINKVNERICTAEIKGHTLVYVSAYAHTLQKSEQDPNNREEFYEILETIIDKTSKRDLLIIGGDFINAKTGTGNKDYPENIGKYGKGIMNSWGKRLLEICKEHDLILTNTLFNHKKCHRATWEAPYRAFTTKDGEERKNPVRNQIDYVIT